MPIAAAIVGASVIGGGVALYSGARAAKAQKRAAEQQSALGREQLETERYIFDKSREDLASSRAVGESAMFQLADLYGVSRPATNQAGEAVANDNGGFTTSPGYQFRQQEGISALDKSAAARGKLNSGQQAKALTAFGQGLASEEFGNYANALRSIAGIGQIANQNEQQAGQAFAAGSAGALGRASDAAGAAGNARASSYANTGSAINSTINNALTAYMYSRSPVLGGASSGAYSGSPSFGGAYA